MEQTLAAGLPPVATLGGMTLPLVGRARVYAYGITPYDVTHLGHAATFMWVDTLARVLHADGTEVIMCRNVTDVDDVLLAAAGRSGSPTTSSPSFSSSTSTRTWPGSACGSRPCSPGRMPTSGR